MADSNEEWELSKENIRPIQQGRKQRVLKVALASHPEDVILQQRQSFENELRTYSGNDPLSVWFKYINWVEQNYPKGGREGHIKQLVERCLSILKEEKYFDDDRFIDLMIKYANLSGKPTEVFNYMYSNKIGCKSAKFFTNWSWELEQLGCLKKADEVLTLGLQLRAEPIERLQSYQKDFEIRFAKRIKGTLETENLETSNGRSAFSVLKPQKKNLAPVVRTGDAVIENKTPLILNRQQPQPKSIKSSAKVPFKIYNSENINPASVQPQSVNRNNFTSENCKENELRPSKWNKVKVKVKSKSAGDVIPDFQFHCDDENDLQIQTPRSVPKISNVLSARRRTPSPPPIALFEPPDPLKVPMYPKNKVYGGAEEYSLEEIRAAEWFEKKKEAEMRRLLEEKMKNEEELKKKVEFLAKKVQLLESHLTVADSKPPITSQANCEADCSKNAAAENNELKTHPKVDEELVVQRQRSEGHVHSLQDNASAFKHKQQLGVSNVDDKCNDTTNYLRAENLMQDLYNRTLSHTGDEDESKNINAVNQVNQHNNISKEGNDKLTFALYHDLSEKIADPIIACSTKENCQTNLSALKQEQLSFMFYQDPTETNADFSSGKQVCNFNNTLKEPSCILPFAVYSDSTEKLPDSEAAKEVGDKENNFEVNDDKLPFSVFHDLTEKLSNSSKICSVINKQDCFSSISKENYFPKEINDEPLCDPVTKKDSDSSENNSSQGLAKKQDCFTDSIRAKKNDIGSSLKQRTETLPFPIFTDSTTEINSSSDKNASNQAGAQKVVTNSESSDEDIENFPPHGYVQEKVKRKLAGVLEPSKDIFFIPLEQQELDENSDIEDDIIYQNRKQFVDETLIPPSNTEQFSTAKFLASTPYVPKDNCLRNSELQDEASEKCGQQNSNLSLKYSSTSKENFSHEENEVPSSSEVKPAAESGYSTDTKTACCSRLPNILSVIYETSSENYKSSSSSSSGSLTKSNNLDQYFAQHISLQKNQSKLESFEPSSLGSISEVSNHVTDKIIRSSSVIDMINRKESEIQIFSVDFDPFDQKETENLLKTIDIRDYENVYFISNSIKGVKTGESIYTLHFTYMIQSQIAEGAYAKVYKCQEIHRSSGKSCQKALKVCKKANEWEFYICSEIQRRLIENNLVSEARNSVINIMSAVKYSDGIVLINEYSDFGTLLDVVNYYKKQNSLMPEIVVMYFTLEILQIISKVHRCNIIHGDIKPDNFLLMHIDFEGNFEKMGVSTSLKLIDFGRAIDLSLYDKGICFTSKLDSNYFKCNEMKDNKPWVFQLDWYGVLSCIHTMLFSEYMSVRKNKNGMWEISKTFKRYWCLALWEPLFNELLNIPKCYEEPDVSRFINMIESKLQENKSRFAMQILSFSKSYPKRR